MTFLVTGTARSGTGWASAYFTRLGYPCGHEKMYNPNVHRGVRRYSDSSWLAVSYLDDIDDETPIIRVVRDPVDVVRSNVLRGFLNRPDCSFDQYVKHHRPDIFTYSEHVDRVISYVATWDLALDERDHFVIRVGQWSASDLVEMVKYATGNEIDEATANRMLRRVGVVNADVRHPAGKRMTYDQIMSRPWSHWLEERAHRWNLNLT